MKIKYPFEPSLKNHLLIALGLALWIFIFLYATEPLDVNELSDQEKLIYLPVYGLFCSFCYILILPLQNLLFKKRGRKWSLESEIILLFTLIGLTFLAMRMVYYYIVMDQHPNAYTLSYFFTNIFLPASFTIFPMVVVVRWLFGRFQEKRLNSDKIEIKGQGSYESLRLNIQDLVYIQSADNYIEVTYKEDSLKKQLIRAKLSDIEKDLSQLTRAHRSYLINPYHFKQWKTGNRKLSIILIDDIEIPVSKTFQSSLEMAVNSTITS